MQLGHGKLAASLGGVSETLGEKPLRTLLAQARKGAGQPIDIKLEASLDSALNSLRTAASSTGAGAGLSELLAAAGKAQKGSLMDLLVKDKGTFGHMQELSTLLDNMSKMDASWLAKLQKQQPAGQDKKSSSSSSDGKDDSNAEESNNNNDGN